MNISLITMFLSVLLAIYILLPPIAKRQLHTHPALQSLLLFGGLGAIMFFGLPEMGGRFGFSAVLAIIVFSVLFLFGPMVIRPLQWAAHDRQLTTFSDLFSYRYRGKIIGPLTTFTLVASCLPMLSGQLLIAGQTLSQQPLTPAENSLSAGIYTILVIAITAWLGCHPKRQAKLRLTLALGVLLALVALVSATILIIVQVFGSAAEMDYWARERGQVQLTHNSEYNYGLISLFLLASLTLPHFYHQQSEAGASRQRTTLTSWLLPLLLLAASLTMFPLIWAGLARQLTTPLQLYPLALASELDIPGLYEVLSLAGLMICTVATTTISQSLIQPIAQYSLRLPVSSTETLWQKVSRHQQVAAMILLVLAFAATHWLQTTSITTLTLVSFVGVAQLTPGVLAALYVPFLNRRGVTAGLSCGLILWLVGLFIPLFTGTSFWSPFGNEQGIHFGISYWIDWLMTSMTFNFCIAILVSRLTQTDSAEIMNAQACMLDELVAPKRLASESCDMNELRKSLSQWIGEAATDQALSMTRQKLNLPQDDLRPLDWRMLREELEMFLYRPLGVAQAEQLMALIMPLSEQIERQQNLYSFESQLARHQNELSGLAAELNKLRLHQQQILQQLPLGACAIDDNHEVVLWNRALAKLTGISIEHAIGTSLDSLPSPWGKLLMQAATNKQLHLFAQEVRIQNNPLWINLHKSAVQQSGQQNGEQVILIEDVTVPLQSTRKLAHTERLVSVGRLAAGVAHEIGNPVTGIACLAQDIKLDSEDEEIRTAAQQILTQTERITRIVRSMIDFSRSGNEHQIQPRAVPLYDTIQQALELLKLQMQHNTLNCQVQLAKDLLVRSDPHQLIQVFLNLLSNARDASESGAPIKISALTQGSEVHVAVTDQGSGIPANKLEQVLEPFYTTKEAGEGTGLGLSLVYSMVRSYGGDLRIESPVHDNRGTRVTVILPRA